MINKILLFLKNIWLFLANNWQVLILITLIFIVLLRIINILIIYKSTKNCEIILNAQALEEYVIAKENKFKKDCFSVENNATPPLNDRKKSISHLENKNDELPF